MTELRPQFPPNPATVPIPAEYASMMNVVSSGDDDSTDECNQNYFILTTNDNENMLHLMYKDKQSVVSLFRSTEIEPMMMLRDRCRMHKESLPYKDYTFLALCHPLLFPALLDANTRTLRTLSRLKDPEYALNIYESCLRNIATAVNGIGNVNTADTYSRMWGDLTRAVRTVTESNRINSQDLLGNTPLHLAVAKQDVTLVKFLILKGANPNIVNNQGVSPFHVAAQMRSLFPLLAPKYNRERRSQEILVYLIYAGAKCCERGRTGCSRICMSAEMRKELFPDAPSLVDEMQFPAESIDFCDNKKAIQHIKELIKGLPNRPNAPSVISALSLDGGGIKGLVLLQILIAIEERVEGKLTDYFDWIVGTSTGAIVAGAIGKGKSLREIQDMYFQFKDTVFQPVALRLPLIHAKYDATVLESFLKRELGEETELSHIKYPMMFFSTVKATTNELILQRTYWKVNGNLSEQDDPRKNPLWRALRRSTAAPTYFDWSEGVFVDGGVAANNPVADLVTELHHWNNSVPERRKVITGCIVSIGCGRVQFEGLGNLGIVVENATATDGHVVERVQVPCQAQNIPLFRLSPHLSQNVELDTRDNNQILTCMWDAFLFTKTHKHELDKIADLLKLIGTNENRRTILT